MIYPAASLLALASLIGPGLSQFQSYPVLYSGSGDDKIEKFAEPIEKAWQFENNLIHYDSWSDFPDKKDKIPYTCTGAYDSWMKPYASSEFTVYEAFYMDCTEKSILFCVHKNVNPVLVTPESMIRKWGKVPSGMRRWVATVVILPTTASASAHQAGPQIVFRDDFFNYTVMAHEISHSIDDYKSPGGRWSETPEFKKTVDDDRVVVTHYARENGPIEEFAEIGVLVTYNVSSKGNLPAFEKNYARVARQLAYVTEKFGGDPLVGWTGNCKGQIDGFHLVNKSDVIGQLYEAPDGFVPVEPSPPYPGLE